MSRLVEITYPEDKKFVCSLKEPVCLGQNGYSYSRQFHKTKHLENLPLIPSMDTVQVGMSLLNLFMQTTELNKTLKHSMQ